MRVKIIRVIIVKIVKIIRVKIRVIVMYVGVFDEDSKNVEDDSENVDEDSERDSIENGVCWCDSEASEYNPRSC